jgi:ABC-type branched-subunit amino acid transport system permease subunit
LGLVADATFAGGLGTASGMAIGAIDSFLIDQVFNRWKPNQFVDDHLRPLLVGKE